MYLQSEPISGIDYIFYNASHGFTWQETLLLAPLRIEDSEEIINLKMQLVARFVDIFLTWRIWNSRSLAYSTVRGAMFRVMRNIRGCSPEALAENLREELLRESETFAGTQPLHLSRWNRRTLHRLLARITDYVEMKSGLKGRYAEYIASGRNRYEVEHIWANHPERHEDEFEHQADFEEQRNRIGGLLLLPKSFNASYSDLPYEEKLPHYNTQNLLARSLHPQAYERNPGFRGFLRESGLPFRSHGRFRREDMERRSELYRQIAEQIWNPDDLIHDVEKAGSGGG